MNQIQRRQAVERVYQQVHILRTTQRWYRKQLKRYILETIREEASNDRTTKKIVGKRQRAVAIIVTKELGIISGIEEIVWSAHELGIQVKRAIKDGQRKKAGTVAIELRGNARLLFAAERTWVNTLQRMSGISTYVNMLARKINAYSTRLAATRKTLWLGLDKKAVAMGGGLTHRVALQTGIMVKTNHIDWMGGQTQLHEIHYPHRFPRIVEVRSLRELKTLLNSEPEYDSILLDNFSPAQIRVTLVWVKKAGVYDRYLFEASGGITADTIVEYARTGVDVISMGKLTQSAPALDMAMKIYRT